MNRIAVLGRQKGMTYLGMVMLLVFIAFLAIVLIKVLPLYLEHFKVQSSLNSLAQDSKDEAAAISPFEIEKLLLNRLNINDVTHVSKENIKITNEGSRTVVTVDYEARVALFYNLDLVARFPDNRVELGGH